MGWYGEDFDSGMPFAKRSISSGSMALTKRASICMRSVFEDLVGWLDLMANDQVHEASMLKGIWDDRFAQRFSLVFLWYNLMRIFSRYTFDRDAAFREILTNPTEAGPGLSDWDQAHDELCEVDDSLSRRADLILGDDGVANGTTPLHHRTLTPWGKPFTIRSSFSQRSITYELTLCFAFRHKQLPVSVCSNRDSRDTCGARGVELRPLAWLPAQLAQPRAHP
jgi:hypothetical protein